MKKEICLVSSTLYLLTKHDTPYFVLKSDIDNNLLLRCIQLNVKFKRNVKSCQRKLMLTVLDAVVENDKRISCITERNETLERA